MKKIIALFAIVFLVVIGGCKKEDQLQLSWWDRLWVKEQYVMVDLNNKHKDVILPKIDQIRTTIQEYVTWDDEVIQVHGPGGYTPTADKAWRVWLDTYHQEFMPDTTVPPKTGELATIITKYLELRRDYDKDKSFTKMRLCIPAEIYEQDERFWEWWLSKVQAYLTVTLGGPSAWTDGTRQLWQEVEIYKLPTTPDPEDPWHCECSAQIRITCWYKAYAEGPKDKSMSITDWNKLDPITRFNKTNEMMRAQYADYDMVMKSVRKDQGQKRYENLLSCPEEGFPLGNPADYETKQGKINGVDVYYIEIPCVPTR